MKKLVLFFCLLIVGVSANAKLLELFRSTGTIQSKCGVTWNFIIHFNWPSEAVKDLQEIKAQIDGACDTGGTFFVS